MAVGVDVDAFAAVMVAVLALGALLPTRFDDREDHFTLQMAAAVTCGALGLRALALLALAVAAALPLVVVLARRRGRPWRRSVGWLLLTTGAAAVGMLAAAALFGPVLGRSFPVVLTGPGDLAAGVATMAVGWWSAVAARCAALALLGRPLLPWSPGAFDSALVPYLLPSMSGFPLVTAALALYDPARPWAAVLLLVGWALPVHAACAYEIGRRDLAHELRRDALATQRLAAIGEVTARVVHQARHQAGLMGWSLHRLRAALDAVPGGAAAAGPELDRLTEAKDRLGRVLASELLFEPAEPGDPGEPGGGADVVVVPVTGLVADVVAQLAGGARERGVAVGTEVGGDGAGAVTVPGRLHDAVFNLVDNAVDAAAREVRVVVDGDVAGGRVRITVADDGPGLADGHRDQAFRPFFTTKPHGTGMGLPIAEALVADAGGTLRHDRTGGRTTFTLEVPAASPPPP